MKSSRAIRKHRLAAGLTQSQLAAKAGLAVVTIEKLEAGKRSAPAVTTAKKLGAALGVDWSIFFAADVDKAPA